MIGDYFLQGEFLSRAKCKDFWHKMYFDDKFEYHKENKKYIYDWIAALLCHSFIWSMCIHFPIIYFISSCNHTLLFNSIIINCVVHAIIDHLKANKKIINLNQDQTFHLIQIFITRILFYSI